MPPSGSGGDPRPAATSRTQCGQHTRHNVHSAATHVAHKTPQTLEWPCRAAQARTRAPVRHAARHGVHLAQHLARVNAGLEPQAPAAGRGGAEGGRAARVSSRRGHAHTHAHTRHAQKQMQTDRQVRAPAVHGRGARERGCMCVGGGRVAAWIAASLAACPPPPPRRQADVRASRPRAAALPPQSPPRMGVGRQAKVGTVAATSPSFVLACF